MFESFHYPLRYFPLSFQTSDYQVVIIQIRCKIDAPFDKVALHHIVFNEEQFPRFETSYIKLVALRDSE